jgi:hypothetical protein
VSDPPRLFELERYSPVTVAALLRLPESNARAFVVASALGSFRRLDGSSERLQSGKQAAGTLVSRKRKALILAVLDISPQRWRALVSNWMQANLAHRCDRGVVFLFARPLFDECPSCHTELLVDEIPPSPRRERGPGFGGSARTTSGQALVLQAVSATSASGGAPLAQALAGTSRLHTPSLSIRDEVGLGASAEAGSVVVADVQDLSLGLQNSPRELGCDCGHPPEMHFISGACKRCDCTGGTS